MNKIFKVVWNRTIQSFVVTSELAKGHVKVSSTAGGTAEEVRSAEQGRLKTLFRLTALSVALLGMSEGVRATITEKPATGGATFAIGNGTTSANGSGALAIGNNAQAKANGTLAIGPNSNLRTTANSNNSMAIGVNIDTTGQKAITIGADTLVNGTGSIGIGSNDSGRRSNNGVIGNNSVGIGTHVQVRGDNITAIGNEIIANKNNTVAIGYSTQATGERTVAIGSETKAMTRNAVVIGNGAQVEADTAAANAGSSGTTTGEGSVAVGASARASGTNATALGQAANAYGQNSFAGGQTSNASGKSSVAIGDGTNSTNNSSTAVGPYSQAIAANATALGTYAYAAGQNALAAGRQAQAANSNAVALGNESKSLGEDSVAIGNGANASQNRAVAFGKNSQATAGDAIAMGEATVASGQNALAFGKANKAEGKDAVAIGTNNNAWKADSIALGRSANADGDRSVAIGLSSHTRQANAVALGNGANADDTNALAIGTSSVAAQAAAIAIGNNAQALKYSSVVIGEGAQSDNSRSVVIGYNASAINPAGSASNQDTNQTVAIGAFANAWGDQSTAIGNNVTAKGNSSIVIGSDDWDTVALKEVSGADGKTVKEVYQEYTGDEMATGQGSYIIPTSGEAAVAIGTKSQATGELSTAFGTGTVATGVASAAFGMGAKATKGNAVAVGAGSTTEKDAEGITEATVNGVQYGNFAGGSKVIAGDQVSFGSAGYERQLKHVAPGAITAESTDAVNGSQLYSVADALAAKINSITGVEYYSVNATEENNTEGNRANNGATGTNSMAAGVAAAAAGDFSVAAGSNANANGNETVAIGHNALANAVSAVAVGQRANASGSEAVALGIDSNASGRYAVAIGNMATVADNKLNGIAIGSGAAASEDYAMAMGLDTKAAGNSSIAFGNNTQATGREAIAIGHLANAVSDNTVAFGVSATSANAGAATFGAYTKAEAVKATALGYSSQAVNENDVALGAESVTEAPHTGAYTLNGSYTAAGTGSYGVVSVGKSGGTKRQIQNVAAGVLSADSTDAVNGSQLYATNSYLLNLANSAQNALGGETAVDGAGNLTVNNLGGTNQNTVHDALAALKTTADTANAAADKANTAVEGAKADIEGNKQAIAAANSAIDDAKNDIAAVVQTAEGNKTAIEGLNTSVGNIQNSITSLNQSVEAAKTHFYSVNSTDGTKGNYNNDGATGENALAAGVDALAAGGSTVAVGNRAQAIGNESVAMGRNAQASADKAIALGDGAAATQAGSIALGSESVTEAAVGTENATVGDLAYGGFAGKTPQGTLSIGASGKERTITNVAAGRVDANSTDAINGSQLYATQTVLGNTAASVRNVLGGNAQLGENGSITMNDVGGTGTSTVDAAIRKLNTAAYKSFKLDTAATNGTNGVAENHTLSEITSGSTITLEAGKNIVLRQTGSTVSINTTETPEFTGVVVAKGGLNMSDNRINNVARGTEEQDAVNLGQLQDAINNLSVSTLTTVSNDAPFSYIDSDGKILRREVKVDSGTGQKTVSFTHADGGTPYSGEVTIAALNPNDPQTSTPTTVGNVKAGVKSNDAVNVSQLNKIAEAIGTKVNADGTIAAPVYTVISGNPATASVASYNTAGQAFSALSDAVRTPLYFEGDTGSRFDRPLGSTVAVKGGQTDTAKLSDNNIGVVANGTDYSLDVKLAKELTGLTSAAFTDGITAAGTTVNAAGVTVGTGSNPVSLSSDGLSNGGKKITNIAEGEADSDAATVKQVKAAKTEVRAGTNVASVVRATDASDGHTVYTVNAKGTALALADNADGLKLTSSEDPAANTTTYKLDLSEGTKASLAKADSALQTVSVQVNGTDAKTLSQDNVALNFVDGAGTAVENKNGGIAFNINKSALTAGSDGTVTADGAGDTFATATDVARAINEAVANSEKTSVVAAGDNTHVAAEEAGNRTTYTVHADKSTVSVKAGGKLAVNSTTAANANQTQTTDYELDLSEEAKADLQKGIDAKTAVETQGVTFAADSGSTSAKKLGDSTSIRGDGRNIVTEVDSDGLTVKLKDNINVTSVSAETFTAGGSTLSSDGLTTPKVTAGNSVLDNGGLKIGSGAAQVALTDSGLDNGGNKITNVADGLLAAGSTDAVNGGQLFAVSQKAGANAAEIAKGIRVGGTDGSNQYALGDTVNIKGDANIVSDTVEGGVQLKLADTVKIGQDTGKPVTIDGTSGTVGGLGNTVLGGTDFAQQGRAATEEQIDAAQTNLADILGAGASNRNGTVSVADIGGTGKTTVSDAVRAVRETAEKGWLLSVNDETPSEKVAPGEAVAFKAGKNVKVSRDGKNITVATADDVEFDSVKAATVEATSGITAPTVTAGDTVLDNSGVKVGNNVASIGSYMVLATSC